jgi:hypothetical protein
MIASPARMISKLLSPSGAAAIVALLGGVLFYFSTKPAHQHFDYTYRIALAILHGQTGISGPKPGWLNELVPGDGKFYSVFPLGAVLTNVPAALLRKIGLVHNWPAGGLAAAIVAGCIYFFHRLTYLKEMSQPRRILLALFPIFATWTWCNLGFAGAWQIALGFAILGQAGALYYTLIRPRPLLAGLWFAVAFGNRTELLITLPVYVYFWMLRPPQGDQVPSSSGNHRLWTRLRTFRLRDVNLRRIVGSLRWRQLAWFGAIPALLLLATAGYNLARFGSVTDFGYSRIPGLLNEPWYRNGLFSLTAIRGNVHEMLFRSLIEIPKFPYYQPHAFGCSIFFACPFLFLLFREGGKQKAAAWLAIGGLTFVLWLHGNPGGWQFSYRYAMILLPWMFLLIAGNGPRRLTATEGVMFLLSVFINGMATYQFLWTTMIHV